MTEIEKRAVENFKTRKKKNKGNRLDNSRFPAGSPMYYYCRYCDADTDCLPESHMCKPKTVCDDCKFLVEHQLMREDR